MAKKIDPENLSEFKESGITIRTEPFLGEIQPESRLTGVILENMEYGNAKRLTFKFERHTADAYLEPIRDMIEFNRVETVQVIIDDLRRLADRLEESCVKALQPKSTD